MKKLLKKTRGLVKGTSTAVLLSAGIHILLLLVASTVVVFSIIQHNEAKFVPVKIDRPKMDLKKLRIKVKDSSKPRQITERIVSTRKSASMPEINVPKMTGMGSGLERGLGGFQIMTDLSKMTLMGSKRSVGNDLVGTFYDFARTSNGGRTGYQPEIQFRCAPFERKIREFLSSGWDPKVFAEFYQAPNKLYATQFLMPCTPSSLAHANFGIKRDDVVWNDALWLVHYKGKIAHKTGGTFRFRGAACDFAMVRVDKKLVWKASWQDRDVSSMDSSGWKSSSSDNKKFGLENMAVRIGDWFTLKPGVPVEMEAIVGENVGGFFSFVLLVEEQGVEYPKNQEGGPILPVFKMAPIPEQMIDLIKYHSIEGDFDLEGGPIFNVY
jgi:hypothetical protein